MTGPRDLLDQLDAAHERWRTGGWAAFEAGMYLPRAVPQLTAALRAALDLADEIEHWGHRFGIAAAKDSAVNDLAAFAAHEDASIVLREQADRLRNAIAAALSPAHPMNTPAPVNQP
ncbi:hypothetical protein [Geodermatophilus chilensis]|uniref:hypothetical protein n=1 Tax=Geodermatophilus chilensis TaxID=2035835 RepID=UPI000C25D249|nr:hypothetical protein [Geodermatophilus chilensis]